MMTTTAQRVTTSATMTTTTTVVTTRQIKTAVQTVLDQALQEVETANFQFPLMTKGGGYLDVLLNVNT